MKKTIIFSILFLLIICFFADRFRIIPQNKSNAEKLDECIKNAFLIGYTRGFKAGRVYYILQIYDSVSFEYLRETDLNIFLSEIKDYETNN